MFSETVVEPSFNKLLGGKVLFLVANFASGPSETVGEEDEKLDVVELAVATIAEMLVRLVERVVGRVV